MDRIVVKYSYMFQIFVFHFLDVYFFVRFSHFTYTSERKEKTASPSTAVRGLGRKEGRKRGRGDGTEAPATQAAPPRCSLLIRHRLLATLCLQLTLAPMGTTSGAGVLRIFHTGFPK